LSWRLFFLANGQRAIRAVSSCSTHASNGQRATRAVSVRSTHASIRPSVFDGAHTFSCGPLITLRKRGNGVPEHGRPTSRLRFAIVRSLGDQSCSNWLHSLVK